MPDIVSIGECMIELFSDEPLGAARSFQKSYAGDTLNVLHMAARLGASTGYVTRVADDPFTDYLLDAWRTNGIDTGAVKRVPGFTGMHFISLLPGGDREFVFYRKGSAASTMTPEDLDVEYIGSARILHISGIPQSVSPSMRRTILQAAQIAREHGVTISYDTNLRANMWSAKEAQEAMSEVLPYVDIVFPSHPEETGALLGLESETEVIDYFRSRGVETVAITCGEGGAVVGTEEGVFSLDAVAPHGVADTTGAGDAFVGGFLHCLVQGLGTVVGAKWGIACAGLKIAGRGAIGSQPGRRQVEELAGSVQVHRL
jgi:2-dehydro-3-deoxygluconokinase